MNAARRIAILAVMATIGLAAGASAAQSDTRQSEPVPAEAKPVLSKTTAWRWHLAWRRPDVVPADPTLAGTASQPETLKPQRSFDEERDTENIEYPPPPAGWTAAGFDDGDWPRNAMPIRPGGGHMGPFHVTSGLLSVRGKFIVDDPKAVRDLYLSFAYRGGAVVYVNGEEVARCDLPEGPIIAATPGLPYPD